MSPTDDEWEAMHVADYEKRRSQTIYKYPFAERRKLSDTPPSSRSSYSREASLDFTSSSDYDEIYTVPDKPLVKSSTLHQDRWARTLSSARRETKCSGKCVIKIKEQEKTIIHQAVENMKLTQKIADLEKELAKCRSHSQSLKSPKMSLKTHSPKPSPKLRHMSERQVKSEAWMDDIYLPDGVLEWLNYIDDVKNGRKPKTNTVKRRKNYKERSRIEGHFTPEMTRMKDLQMKLSEHITKVDDIYNLFRSFYSNSEPFIANLKQKPDSLKEKFHEAFTELTKLGAESFNPSTLHEYYKKMENQKFVEIVEPFLHQDSNESANEEE